MGFHQVGGKLSSLESHIAAVKSNSLFGGTDFKLASSHSPLDDKVAHDCGFTTLSIRIVKVFAFSSSLFGFLQGLTCFGLRRNWNYFVCFQELVTFSSHPLLNPPDISNAGQHLSAAEFHSVLQSAGKYPFVPLNQIVWFYGGNDDFEMWSIC